MRYVGQSTGDFNPYYYGSGIDIKKALDQYGKENFTIRVVEYADSRQELNDKEFDWIIKTNAVISENYYNRSYKTHGGSTKPKSAEHRRKIGLGNKGKVRSDEYKAKMSEVKTGQKYSNRKKSGPQTEEHKENIRKALKGKVTNTPESIEKIRETVKIGWTMTPGRRAYFDRNKK